MAQPLPEPDRFAGVVAAAVEAFETDSTYSAEVVEAARHIEQMAETRRAGQIKAGQTRRLRQAAQA